MRVYEIKYKLFAIFVLVLSMLYTLYFISFKADSDERNYMEIQENVDRISSFYRVVTSKMIERKLKNSIDLMLLDRDLVRAVEEKDIERLKSISKPIYKIMHNSNRNFNRLSFFDRDKNSIMKIYKDTLETTSSELLFGTGVSREGDSLEYIISREVVVDSKIVGFLQVGVDMHIITDNIKRLFSVEEVFFVLDDGVHFLNGSEVALDMFDSIDYLSNRNFFYFEYKNRHYIVNSNFDIFDSSRKKVATMVVFFDVTNEMLSFNRAFNDKIKFHSLIFILTIALFYYFLRFFIKKVSGDLKFKESVIDSLSIAISIKRVSGEYIYCNSSFESFMGVKREKLIGKTAFEFFSEEMAKRIEVDDKTLIVGKSSRVFRRDLILKDGFKHPLVFYKSLVFNKYREPKYIVTAITNFQDLSISMDEMKSLNIAQNSEKSLHHLLITSLKDTIFSITHHWKQPLKSVRKNSADIEALFVNDIINKVTLKRKVSKIIEEIEKMDRTLNDFRKFFNHSSKKSVFDVKEIISETLFILSSEFNDLNIDVHIRGDGFEVESYSDEFRQAVLNILNNAKDALASQKELDRDFNAIIDIEIVDRVIVVFNSGSHIPDYLINKIFEPYFTTKDSLNSFGSSLYVTKILIEHNMNGVIEAKNSFIERDSFISGVEFRIELP
jgi:PAS domain S-box-containing protein